MRALRLTLAVVAALAASGAARVQAQAREVRIGTEAAFPPYTFRDRAGELRGFDIELGNEICHRAKLSCRWVVNDWESILPNLIGGKYDVVMAGMAATPERARVVDFSLGYESGSSAASAVLMRAGAPSSDAPHVGVQAATIHEGWARAMAARVTTFATLEAAVEALYASRIDEVVGPQAFLEGVARSTAGRLRVVETFGIPSGDTAAAFRKEDVALRETFDSAIAEMLQDGSIAAMADKWFRAGNGTD